MCVHKLGKKTAAMTAMKFELGEYMNSEEKMKVLWVEWVGKTTMKILVVKGVVEFE